jgi:hypothetical protein
MGPLLLSAGVSTGVVDFSSELSILLTGLVTVVCVAAGMIGVIACRHALSQTATVPGDNLLAAPDEQAAA